jgi:3',5'-cyclic-nucleotide phosphodiesterase
MHATALALAALLAAQPASPRQSHGDASQPAFELRALGVLGGDLDTNLSSYLLGLPGAPPVLMLDAGSIVPGLVRWKQREGALPADPGPAAQAHMALETLRPLEAVLITHAHLDHVGGLIPQSTLELSMALQGHAPMELVGLPETTEALREHIFHSPLWADFTAVPKDHPTFRLAPLKPGEERALGPFRVQAIPLNHPVPCAAFLIQRGEAAYLHLGDTAATEAVWKAGAPLLAEHRLRAVAVEVSFPAAQEKLAQSSGHLTRNSLLLELAKLARLPVHEPLPAAGEMSEADARALAGRLAPAFRECPVIATHIKALQYDQVVAELKVVQEAGLNLIVPEQGAAYRF